MQLFILQLFKNILTRIGAVLSGGVLHQLQMVVNYMRLGRWMAQHGFLPARRVRNRTAIFDYVAGRVRSAKVLYAEFGVYKGASLRYWSAALTNPESHLHGFDSFEGLPEDFDDVDGPLLKGTLSTQGVMPEFDDDRVHLYKGWFDAVLPGYVPPEHDVLIVTLDADLYTSTVTVLQYLRPWIVPGSFLYFDDLSHPDHEARAFDEFMIESGLKFRLLCADQTLNQAFFECVGG